MKLTKAEFLKQIAELAETQRRIIEAEVDGFETDEAASKSRIDQTQNDFRFFCQTYFPHYIKADQDGVVHESKFHTFVYDEFPGYIDDQEGQQTAIAAPRGEAKSTLITQLFTLWCVITGRKHFIVILMDSFDQAAMMLEAIKVELDTNPRLAQDYPKISGTGRIWKVGVVLTLNNVKIQVAGSGKKIRGWRHGPYRPDLTIMDDIENDENVLKKEQRDKVTQWINKAVLNLTGPDSSMDVIYIGTILHYDSALNRILKNPVLWNTYVFKSIIQMPDRLDLWDQWEEILINEGKRAADSFYRRRKKIMDAGAIVSWPGVRPLLQLMKIRAKDHHAFDCEYQNDPTDSEHALFKDLTFWVHVVDAWLFYGSCDPSLGKQNKRRDPSAVLVGGMHKKSGVLDVVEADIRRRVPDLIIERIIQLQEQYGCLVWGIETVQFQAFLMTELIKRSAERGIPVPAIGITPTYEKQLRIESMQPHVVNGLIRFHKSHTTLIEQMRHYPEADHDDGPDGLQMLWEVAIKGLGGIPQIKTRKRYSIDYANAY